MASYEPPAKPPGAMYKVDRMGGYKEAFTDHLTGLVHTPSRLKARAFKRRTLESQLVHDKRESGVEMVRKLWWMDMIIFGVGSMVGAGVFVITGAAANGLAGPSVLLSYTVSGIAALLSALCYTEFAVQLPVGGGAFAYVALTFGEFPAYITAAMLLMEYVLSGAAVARSFTSYLAALCNQSETSFRVHTPDYELDFIAVAMILLLSALLCWGTKESSSFNVAVTAVHIAIMLFIIIAGFTKGDTGNLSPFTPFGVRGVFNAATQVFFSYIGFDAVATMAEEVIKPERDLPIGIVGSVILTTVLYVGMALALVLLQPYQLIDPDAPYALAFSAVGWNWAKYIVAIAALFGIVTVLMVDLLGQARILLVVCRSHLLPGLFAKINTRTQTPVNSTVILGILTAVIGFVTDFATLANMVSIGTLFVFFVVAACLIFRRTYAEGVNKPWLPLIHIVVIALFSIGMSTYYRVVTDNWYGIAAFAGAWAIATLSLHITCPTVYRAERWSAPLMPWLASASMLLNAFLLGTLDYKSYIRFGIWAGIATFVYIVYGVHASWRHAERLTARDAEDRRELEMKYIKEHRAGDA